VFKHILVPLDGSGRAEQALPVAARLAHASGAAITLLRVVDTSPASFPSAGAKPILIQTVSETDIRLAKSYLDGIATSPMFTHIHVEARAVAGLVSSTILSEAVSQQVDMIILCSHGLTGVSRWTLGSVAEKIARYGTIPTLVLREGGPTLDKATSVRVLVPLDGSSQSEAALAPAAQLASALSTPEKGALHLLHIVKPASNTQVVTGMTSDAQESPASIRMAKQYLDSTVGNFRNTSEDTALAVSKLTVTSLVTSDSDVAHAIVQEAEHNSSSATGNAHIIAMAAYGNNGPQNWTLGSITERVLHSTRLPLFIVQPPTTAERR